MHVSHQYSDIPWPTETSDWASERHRLFDFYSEWAKAIALQYYTRYPVDGADPDDYIHYASIGLLEAIDSFFYRLKTSSISSAA